MRNGSRQKQRSCNDPDERVTEARDREAAEQALQTCTSTLATLKEGIDLVCSDDVAYQAFGFMNRVMHSQRLHSLFASAKRQDEKLQLSPEVEAKETPSWRLFQLAFILISLPSLTKLDHPERRDG